MKLFKMADVEKIEKMLADGLKVEVEWHSPYEKGTKTETVKYVRWDGMAWYLLLEIASIPELISS